GVGASLKLLEVNRPMQALSILNRLDKTARIYSLMADAYSAGGNYEKALEFSQMAVQEEPTNKRYRLQAARIQSMRLMK
ncbi:MAG TPA: hypothetical protein VEF04_03840, partial [Blastocatellia bacterium]|nr:hypothetical protein [Blastocatellia bacterium]